MSAGMLSIILFLFIVSAYLTLIGMRAGEKSKVLEAIPAANVESFGDFGFEDRVYNNRYNPFYRKHVKQHMEGGLPKYLRTRLFARSEETLRARLMAAGADEKISVDEMISLKIIVFLASLITLGFFVATQSIVAFLVMLPGFYHSLAGFEFSLARQAKKRTEQILRELPEFLTLLKAVMDTGVSIQRGIELMVAKYPGTLSGEFQKAIVEQQANGGNWARAMENMGLRNNIEELSTVLSDILLAYQRGSDIKEVLNEQAKEMREVYTVTVEEKARGMSVKLLIPLVMFSFAPLFALIIMPLMMNFSATFQ